MIYKISRQLSEHNRLILVSSIGFHPGWIQLQSWKKLGSQNCFFCYGGTCLFFKTEKNCNSYQAIFVQMHKQNVETRANTPTIKRNIFVCLKTKIKLFLAIEENRWFLVLVGLNEICVALYMSTSLVFRFKDEQYSSAQLDYIITYNLQEVSINFNQYSVILTNFSKPVEFRNLDILF